VNRFTRLGVLDSFLKHHQIGALPSPVGFGSWPCKNAFPRQVDERRGSVQSQAAIAAISGLVPTMFMTRIRL
jgi:hypothetical protein